MRAVEHIPRAVVAQQGSRSSLIVSRDAVEDVKRQTESSARLAVPKPECASTPAKEL